MRIEQIAIWNDVRELPKETGKFGEWGKSDTIWIRVKEVKNRQGRVVREAYTALGECLFPLKVGAHLPVPKNDPDAIVSNPATTVSWLHDTPYFAINRKRVDASHWLPCVIPHPPGTPIYYVETGTIGTTHTVIFQ